MRFGVASVFSALACEGRRQLAERIQAFLKAFAPFYLAKEGSGTAPLEQRLQLDMIRDGMLSYLEGKEADIEQAVEHDIQTWIEANAPAMASATLGLMEQRLAEPGAKAP